MRLAIDRAALLKALQHVTSVVERRVTIPILSNVYVGRGEGVLRLKATDLDIEVSETIAATTETPGETTVSAHMLHDIVRKLPDGTQVDAGAGRKRRARQFVRRTGALRPRLPSRHGLPRHRVGRDEPQLRAARRALRKMIERTRFAISTEETRYYLNGIYFHTVTAMTASGCAPSRRTAIASPRPTRAARRREGHARRDYPAQDGLGSLQAAGDRSAPVQIEPVERQDPLHVSTAARTSLGRKALS